MLKLRRLSQFVALSVCLVASGWGDTVFADEPQAGRAVASIPAIHLSATQQFSSSSSNGSRLIVGDHTRQAMTIPEIASLPLQSTTLAQRRYGGDGRRRHRAAPAQKILRAAPAGTPGARLALPHTPPSSVNALAGGCSYGTKVVGTAVTAGGVVTFLTGALTWR